MEDRKVKAYGILSKLAFSQKYYSFFLKSFVPCILFFNSNDYVYFVKTIIFPQKCCGYNQGDFLLQFY